jgi:hypothetical protein
VFALDASNAGYKSKGYTSKWLARIKCSLVGW